MSTFHSGCSRSRLRCRYTSTCPRAVAKKTRLLRSSTRPSQLITREAELITREAERPHELLQTVAPYRNAQRAAVELPKQWSGCTDHGVPMEIPGLRQLRKSTPVSGIDASVLGIATTHDACCTV